MSGSVTFEELVSVAKRTSIGVRTIKTALQTRRVDAQGIVQWVWNSWEQLGGWLIENAVKLIGGGFVGLLNLFWNTVTFVDNFNWNASDEDLDGQINQIGEALAAKVGGSVGKILGYTVGGVLPGAVIYVLNPAMGTYILKNALPEFAEEILIDLEQLVALCLQSAVRAVGITIFKQGRRFVKWYAKFFEGYIPQDWSTRIEKWGGKNSTPWSFAAARDEWIESIGLGWVKQGVQNFADEFGEATREASFVIAQGADAFLAEQKLANQVANPVGEVRTVEVIPNRANPDENYILVGNEALLRQQITSTIAESHRIEDKDIGMVYAANPAKEEANVRFQPMLHLEFKETKDAMLERGETRQAEGEISIRLVNYTSETITLAYLTTLAQTVKEKLATPRFVWHRGSQRYTYFEPSKGIRFTVMVVSETEAKRLIEQVLECINATPDWDNLRKGSSKVTPDSTTTPKKVPILGELVPQPIRGKESYVSFLSAQVFIYGKNNRPVHLYHAYGRYRNALVK